jgi:hypothetical protein
LEEFPDVFEGRAFIPSLLNYVLCSFEEEMGLFEAGAVSLYYGDEFRRIIFRVFREAFQQFFG